MESRILQIEEKLSLLRALGQCGLDRIEITSFVNPAKMPQFADAELFCKQVYASGEKLPPLMAFTANEKGLDRLLAFPLPWVACFVSVSEAFNQRNVNATVAKSLDQVRTIVEKSKKEKRRVRVYVSTVFGCPYQGPIADEGLETVFREVAALDPDEIALGDTIGVATPSQVKKIVGRLSSFFPSEKIAAHFHNTFGMGLAAAWAAYEAGVRSFDGAVGGIGGCPYAKGASGNLSSEDLLYLFQREGVGASFSASAFQAALKQCQALGLNPQGALSAVWQKGGNWYGV
jgi:hydroxymethylglutaryl-CoA lyase